MKQLIRFAKDIKTYLYRTAIIAKPYWFSEEKNRARLFIAIILALQFIQIGVAARLSYANADLFDAIEARNIEEIWKQLILWTSLIVGTLAAMIASLHFRDMLIVDWRRFLTRRFVKDYLGAGIFNQLELKDYNVDNPDQRIAMDMQNFASETLELSLGFIGSIGNMVAFSLILWSVSGDLTIPVAGFEVVIPGYMFWVALSYAIFSTWLTHKTGKRLIPLNFEKQAVEADFRYGLVRIRENAESIALIRGQDEEAQNLETRFAAIRSNWVEVLRYKKRVLGVVLGLRELSDFFPFIVALPALMIGTVAIGGLLQLRGAFMSVVFQLSWFVSAYQQIAVWKSSVDRLITFEDALAEAKNDKAKSGYLWSTAKGKDYEINDLSIRLPNGPQLLEEVNLRLKAGQNTVITGKSGSGKTTLFRALSGQWVWGGGELGIPPGSVMFLPQKSYFPIGTLRAALAYPNSPDDFDTAQLKEALSLCCMDAFIDRLDEEGDWARTLSGGEQQRMSIVRAVLAKPNWLFLDEATSALDPATEEIIYDALDSALPNTTLISIAHRESLKKYHHQELRLEPDDKTLLLTPLPGPA